MSNGPNIQDQNSSIPPNAVSLYGQNDAMDDFPVLKAFQQYIDAEQAKAQKRMTTMCLSFALIMAIVVGVFVMLLLNLGQRNNALSDQLFQFMLKDRERQQPVVVQQPVAQPAAGQTESVKMLTDTVTALQKQLSEQQMKMFEQQSKLLEQQVQAAAAETAKRAAAQAPSPAPVVQPAAPAVTAKSIEEETKAQKLIAQLAEEKARLEKEKEALRQSKIEMQRRKLYPDYYAKLDAEKAAQEAAAKAPATPAAPAKAPAKVEVDDEDDEDEDMDLEDDEEDLDTLLEITPADLKPKAAGETKAPAPKKSASVTSGWELPLD